MKRTFFALAFFAFAAPAFSGEARWIWYPGDYGIWWGNELQSQRLQWGARLAPFWPLYAPETRVLFRKDGLKLAADEPLEVRCDGHAAFCYTDEKGADRESAVVGGKFLLPKTAKRIEIRVQNTARPPSVWVKGPTIVSDASWTAGWTTPWDMSENVPVETSARFADPGTPPGLTRLPVKEKPPKWVKAYKGNHVIADFGEETYGYLRLKDVKGSGAVKIIYAESEAEMYADDLLTTEFGALDGWEQVELSETPEFRREIAYGFRYVHVIPVSGDVTVGSVTMDYEWKGVPVRGSFRCSDEKLNRIWDVSIHTLDLTCREVFIEGVKRDHWVWSGDAVQSFLMNYYAFGDYDGCRDTLWTLRGKDPVKCHLNRIMDYTFYWFDAVEKYRLYSGDPVFARQVYPRMKTLMDFALSRLDGKGRPADREGDWLFIDWAPKTLPNYGGVTSFEQMLLVRALEATAGVARDVGAADDAKAFLARAKSLRAEIVPRYWNAEKGALMHVIYNDGRVDPMVTRYPNMFGLFYGYFDEAQKKSVVENVMLNGDVMKIQTPYMRFYELEALCALGMQSDVLKEIRSYWGGMLDLGATSFWELYNPDEKGDAHYAMYGRRFGRSLCHAWGASPVYLLGRYFLGVVPTGPGFSTYDVSPATGGLEWMEGEVPTPRGTVRVTVRNGRATVRGDGFGRGTLHWNGKTAEIPPEGEVSL